MTTAVPARRKSRTPRAHDVPAARHDVPASPHDVPATPTAYSIPSLPAVRTASVSVVIPTKNEARNISWVLERMPEWVSEVVIVDGRSTDGTVEVARRSSPDVIVVHHAEPGKGAAIRAGFAAATEDIIVMIDADGSMDPADIGQFVDAIHGGADLAKGSRRIEGGGSSDLTLIRDLGNRALLLAANVLFRTSFSELCYGFMAVRRSAIPDLNLVSDGFEIETEIVARAVRVGHRIVEVPSFERPRRYGSSNLSAVRDGLRIVRTLLQVRTGFGRPEDAIPVPFMATASAVGDQAGRRPAA